MDNNNNPPEQAGALKKIYQARKELYEANEGDITDLKRRLEQAMEKKIDLAEQMNDAKTSYDEASSKIVDLLDDDEDDYGDNDEKNKNKIPQTNRNNHKDNINQEEEKKDNNDNNDNDNDKGLNERKPATKRTPNESSASSLPLKRTPRNYKQHMTKTTTTTMTTPQQSKSTLKRTPGNYEQHMMMMSQLQPPPPPSSPPEIVDLVDDDDDDDDDNDDSDYCNDNDNEDDRMNKIRRRKKKIQAAKPAARINNSKKENGVCSTKKRPRSTSTTSINGSNSISSPPNEQLMLDVTKKRPRSTSNLTMTIRNRIRPSDIPQDRWLQSSIGRTRDELNSIDDMVQYMGSCKFGQSCICSMFGKVHAIVLNDEWNELVQTIDEQQLWYVGLGPGRKRDAGLVAACSSTIPIFHAPKVEYKTKELFYVGHYKVLNIKEYDPPISITDQERQLSLTFTFVEFDIKLATIINNA